MKITFSVMAKRAWADMNPLMKHELSVAQSLCKFSPEFAEQFEPLFSKWLDLLKVVHREKIAEKKNGFVAFGPRYEAESKESEAFHKWRGLLWEFEERTLESFAGRE